ncbi:uncharacterized protein LOC119575590 [Penaeus monodon]|uniref:uncharacterized protein LOC119575590 n=1 Tax=Penaeus monodon TaxID=6687 RepID=UPI0018A7D56D|nr:uncharacterized protein LOC119575590 [Penaeus monodon]
MGDTEQIVAEPDEMDAEDVEGLHPNSLHPQTPQLISHFIYNVMTLITSFGWYVVGLSALGYFLWLRLQPKVNQWKEQRERDQEAAELHKNPDKVLARERAIEAARQRMQEEYNKHAVAHAEKVQEVSINKKLRMLYCNVWNLFIVERRTPGTYRRLGTANERGEEGYRNKTKTYSKHQQQWFARPFCFHSLKLQGTQDYGQCLVTIPLREKEVDLADSDLTEEGLLLVDEVNILYNFHTFKKASI